MPWHVYGVLGALFDASYYAIVKRLLSDIDGRAIACGAFLTTGCLLLIASALQGFPSTGRYLLPAVLATGSLNVVAALLYFKALSITDLSLSVPMISFTPIFLMFTSFMLLDEKPNWQGTLGIVLIVTGAYVLNTSGGKGDLLEPLKRMLREKGILYMLVVAFIFSITSNLDKIVVRNSDPVLGSALIFLYAGGVFILILRKSSVTLGKNGRILSGLPLAGLMLALSAVSINVAYTKQIVPYVISLKRLSIVFAVLFGGIAFGEKQILRKLFGALLMFLGVVFIVLS